MFIIVLSDKILQQNSIVWWSLKWIFTANAVCMNSACTLLKFSGKII
jgi:hypothetical protein